MIISFVRFGLDVIYVPAAGAVEYLARGMRIAVRCEGIERSMDFAYCREKNCIPAALLRRNSSRVEQVANMAKG